MKKHYLTVMLFLSISCVQLAHAQQFMPQQSQEQAYEGYFNRCMAKGEYKQYMSSAYTPQEYCKSMAFSIIMSMMDYYPSEPSTSSLPSPQEIANCKTLVNLFETGKTTCNPTSCDYIKQRVQACKTYGM